MKPTPAFSHLFFKWFKPIKFEYYQVCVAGLVRCLTTMTRKKPVTNIKKLFESRECSNKPCIYFLFN